VFYEQGVNLLPSTEGSKSDPSVGALQHAATWEVAIAGCGLVILNLNLTDKNLKEPNKLN
jgi:hypothetical protein